MSIEEMPQEETMVPKINIELGPSNEQKEKAKAELIADLKSGFWFQVDDGLEIKNSATGSSEKLNRLVVSETGPCRTETYDYNNGVIAVITKNGKHFVTPFTEERMKLVQIAYEQGSIPVTFSNGEKPTDERLKQKWEDLETVARAEKIKKEILAEQKL